MIRFGLIGTALCARLGGSCDSAAIIEAIRPPHNKSGAAS